MQIKCCAKLLLVESKVVNMQQINGSHCLVHFATTYWDHIGSISANRGHPARGM